MIITDNNNNNAILYEQCEQLQAFRCICTIMISISINVVNITSHYCILNNPRGGGGGILWFSIRYVVPAVAEIPHDRSSRVIS